MSPPTKKVKSSSNRERGSLDVLVHGLQGLGLEVAKNLILSGVIKNITIHDEAVCQLADLSSQYYLTKEDLGRNRAEASYESISKLNINVQVIVHTDPLTTDFLWQFKIIVLTNASLEEQMDIANLCHNKVAIIIADTRGLFGRIFCDFGQGFKVKEPDDEPLTKANIGSISRNQEGKVVCKKDVSYGHGLGEGDYVTFSGIQGMVELNDSNPIQVTVIDRYTFNIGDTSAYGAYTGGGVVQKVKMPRTLSFNSLEVAMEAPRFLVTDYSKESRILQLHLAFRALLEFEKKHLRPMLPWNENEAQNLLRKVGKLNKSTRHPVKAIDKNFIRKFSFVSSGNICPLQSVIGGLAAQEALKAYTGRFTPIYQWLYFDAAECLPDDVLTHEMFQAMNTRYDAQIAIFGKEFQQKLNSLNCFLIGAGVIGAELLKNFAMMGIGSTAGTVYVTDMDLNVPSRITKPFLYRAVDVGIRKSEAIARSIKSMNKDTQNMSVISHEGKGELEEKNVFNDRFYEVLDVMVNATDNYDARLYIDQKCVHYGKPLLDTGILGVKGSVQVIVPHLTESYISSQDPPANMMSMGSIKGFPYAVEHTLQWARDEFEGHFKADMENAVRFLSDPQFLQRTLQLSGGQPIDILSSVKKTLVDDKPKSFEDCIVWARRLFQKRFNDEIQDILKKFSADELTSPAEFLWPGLKRYPLPLDFNPCEEPHLDFIVSAANIRAYAFGIQGGQDRHQIRDFVSTLKPSVFIRKESDTIQPEPGTRATDKDKIQEILTAIGNTDSNTELRAVKFNDNSDRNYHAEFLTAAATLRAENFGIFRTNKRDSKLLISKMLPVSVSAAAVVAGLACLELYKVVQGNDKLFRYKNRFFNLSLPCFQSVQPMLAPKMKYQDKTYTIWDRFDVQGEMTLKEFLDHFKTVHQVDVSLVLKGQQLIYSHMMKQKLLEKFLPLNMSELVEKLTRKELDDDVRALTLKIRCLKFGNNIPKIQGALGLPVEEEMPFVRYTIPPHEH